MGNQTSTDQQKQSNDDKLKPKSISQILDYVSTYYILTMDFKSLRKLYEKEYCDKLVILTSDIVQRYFTDLEITYLSQRVKNGVEINETAKDNVIFFNKDDLNKLDIQNSIKKKRICLSIAKFYIKIAHLFSAIVTTINPIYVYKDAEGATVKASLYEKGSIPTNTPRTIYKLNICDNRINALKNNENMTPDENGNISVHPKMCTINTLDDGSDKSLNDEPGIPELMELYYDDNYDYKTGKFTGMSQKHALHFIDVVQEYNVPFYLRYLYIPGFTDDYKDIDHFIDYAKTLTNLKGIEFLPYHRIGVSKWNALNIKYPLEQVQVPSKETIDEARNYFTNAGMYVI